jgi:hypothetical protein
VTVSIVVTASYNGVESNTCRRPNSPAARAASNATSKTRSGRSEDTGFGRFPFRIFAINAAWLELALTGIDLLAWTQTLLLHGDLARAEPKKLCYRLLHVAAPITRSGRRTWLRLPGNWP